MEIVKLLQVLFGYSTDCIGIPVLRRGLITAVQQLDPSREGGRKSAEDGWSAGASRLSRDRFFFVVAAS